MIKMVVLFCLNAVPHEACTEANAVQISRPAEAYFTTMGCAVASMRLLPIFEDADDATHPVIKCLQSSR